MDGDLDFDLDRDLDLDLDCDVFASRDCSSLSGRRDAIFAFFLVVVVQQQRRRLLLGWLWGERQAAPASKQAAA